MGREGLPVPRSDPLIVSHFPCYQWFRVTMCPAVEQALEES